MIHYVYAHVLALQFPRELPPSFLSSSLVGRVVLVQELPPPLRPEARGNHTCFMLHGYALSVIINGVHNSHLIVNTYGFPFLGRRGWLLFLVDLQVFFKLFIKFHLLCRLFLAPNI